MRERFWECYGLDELHADEWEALCDGCAKCCLIKLVDEDVYASNEKSSPTIPVHYTNVACKALKLDSCRCKHYQQRHARVPDCVQLEQGFKAWHMMPFSCAYRKLHEGRPLADWHPLLSGSTATVHAAGVSIRGKVLAENNVHPDALEEHIVHWVNREPQ